MKSNFNFLLFLVSFSFFSGQVAAEISYFEKPRLIQPRPKKKTGSNTAAKSSKSKGKQSRKNNKKSCTYHGHPLYVGPKGGCYYIAGKSKEYVDRSYCADCN